MNKAYFWATVVVLAGLGITLMLTIEPSSVAP